MAASRLACGPPWAVLLNLAFESNAFSRMRHLERKIVVITGGAIGIGIGCAIRLAAEGATLAIVDREVVAFSEAKA